MAMLKAIHTTPGVPAEASRRAIQLSAFDVAGNHLSNPSPSVLLQSSSPIWRKM